MYCFRMTEASVERQAFIGVSILQVVFHITVKLNARPLRCRRKVKSYFSCLSWELKCSINTSARKWQRPEEAFSRQATSAVFLVFGLLFTPLGAFKYLSDVIICNSHNSRRAAVVSPAREKWGSFELQSLRKACLWSVPHLGYKRNVMEGHVGCQGLCSSCLLVNFFCIPIYIWLHWPIFLFAYLWFFHLWHCVRVCTK